MQNQRLLILGLSTCVLLLGACNLVPPNATSTPDPARIEALVQTRIASMPTETQLPTPVSAPTATPTITAPLPTPTLTLFYQASATPTPSLTECPLIVALKDTPKGDLLHIRRCEDNLEYDLGPFAKGVYAAGPNYKFIVYVTDTGYVYASKVGNPYLALVVNLVRERKFVAINKGALPEFTISFEGEEPRYKLALYEDKYKQKFRYDLPLGITQ